MKEWLKKRLGEISLKAGIAALLFLIAIFIFAFIAHEIVLEDEKWFDEKAFSFFRNNSTPPLTRLMKAISFFGDSYFLFPAYVIVVGWLLLKQKKADAINIAIIGVSSFALLHILKGLFQRNRPQLPLFEDLKNYSFPSGHALSSFVFCSVLVFLTSKSGLSKAWKWGLSVFLVLFSLLIGISRIVLRYHYASDVLAGFCLGFAWVFIFLWLQTKFEKKLIRAVN